jgi:hypothetical protein
LFGGRFKQDGQDRQDKEEIVSFNHFFIESMIKFFLFHPVYPVHPVNFFSPALS